MLSKVKSVAAVTQDDKKLADCRGFMDNSPTNQLADTATNQLAEIDIMTFRLTPKCNEKVYESSAHLLNRQI